MSRPIFLVALIGAALTAKTANGQPGGGIFTNGATQSGAGYSQATPAPTSETSPGPQFSHFAPNGGINQLALNWWYYRVQGDTRERPFGIYTKSDGFTITGTSSWPANGNGQTATYNWTENGASGVRFTAAWTSTISGFSGPRNGTLSQSFQVTNPNSTPLSISLFNLAYWQLSDNPDKIVIASGDINSISAQDGTYQIAHSAVGASAFQAAKDQALINILTDGSVSNLNDTGLPYFDSRFTDAFQWDLTVPPTSAVTVQCTLFAAPAVPEPSTLLLVGGAGATWCFWRSRRYAPQSEG
jgi:hypothetical protein